MPARYARIADELEQAIRSDEYHGRLPPVRDLARRHGVSLRTMHRALGRLGQRDLIRADSTRGNRILHHPKSKLIGVFCNFRKGRPSDTVIATLRQAIEADGHDGVFMDVPETVCANAKSVFWRYGWADGYIFLYGTADTEIGARLKEFNLPSVAANRGVRPVPVSCVDFDHVDMLRRFCIQLYSSGYRRIALSFTIPSRPIYDDAAEAFSDFLRDRGLKVPAAFLPRPEDIASDVPREIRIYRQFERFFRAGESPDAIICFHRGMALARELATRFHRRLNEDIVLVGTGRDDLPGPGFLPVEFSYRRLAVELWEALKSLIPLDDPERIVQRLIHADAWDFSVIRARNASDGR